MYFFKLILLNIFRQKKYAFSLFATMCVVCLAITAVAGIYTNSMENIKAVSEKYVTTVEPFFYPLRSQLNKAQTSGKTGLYINDVAIWEDSEEVEKLAYQQPCAFSAYLWQLFYTADDFSEDGDIIITDPELLETVYTDSLLNSEYCSIELIDGEYIGNDLNSDGTVPILISKYLSEKTGAGINDIIIISQSDNMLMPTDEFKVSGIFYSDMESNNLRIYFPRNVVEACYKANGIETAGSYMELVLNMKYVLSSPDGAEAFISEAYPYFQEKGYILQANDYEYKKEVYSLEMMLRLNNVIGTGVIMLCLVLLLIITLQSIRVRHSEFTIFRLLSLKRRSLISVYLLEKALLLLPAGLLGIIAGTILLHLSLTVRTASFLLYSVLIMLAISLALILICFLIYLHKSKSSLTGETADGK